MRGKGSRRDGERGLLIWPQKALDLTEYWVRIMCNPVQPRLVPGVLNKKGDTCLYWCRLIRMVVGGEVS